MNKTLAGLLSSATALTFIGMAPPAFASGNIPLTFGAKWVGDCNSGQVQLTVTATCNGKTQTIVWPNQPDFVECYPGSNTPCLPYNGLTVPSYFDAAYNVDSYAQGAVTNFNPQWPAEYGFPCAPGPYSPITVGTLVNINACPSGGTTGVWTIRNRGTTALDLDMPNGTVYKEDTYTSFSTCQAAMTDLNNICYNTKGCEPVQNDAACQGG